MPVELRRPAADITVCPDRELIARTRTGDSNAFAELYRRYEGIALARAKQLVRSVSDSEDIVAEAFASILDLLRRGGGPEDDFRPYLFTCIRHGCTDRSRGSRTVAVDPIEMENSAPANLAEFTDGVETTMVLRAAFAAVPSRWQRILWRMEVEDRSIGDLAKELSLSRGAVASLSYRARNALSTAYLDAYQANPSRPQCAETGQQLSGYVRRSLCAGEQRRVEAHLTGCSSCRSSVGELGELNRALRG